MKPQDIKISQDQTIKEPKNKDQTEEDAQKGQQCWKTHLEDKIKKVILLRLICRID